MAAAEVEAEWLGARDLEDGCTVCNIPDAILDGAISLTSDIPVDLACRIATSLVCFSEGK